MCSMNLKSFHGLKHWLIRFFFQPIGDDGHKERTTYQTVSKMREKLTQETNKAHVLCRWKRQCKGCAYGGTELRRESDNDFFDCST